MSSARSETMSSNEAYKQAGGKTKYGKPTGRREVLLKYKARKVDGYIISLTYLPQNLRELSIENRILGYGLNTVYPCIPALVAKERRRANRLILEDQLLSIVENEAS